MKLTREQIYGIVGALLLCLAIWLLLMLISLRIQYPVIEEGIPVEYGTAEWASGMFEPESIEIIEEIEPTPAVTPAPIIQNTEQTVAVESAKEKAEKERIAAEKAAEKKRLEEEKQRKDAINKQMSNAFGIGSGQGSQGTAENGTGNQGSLTGNAVSGAASGIGGIGFSLDGRSVRGGVLPRPAYTAQEEGTIVVEITVNPQGQVTQATVKLRGTNIDNTNMRRSAMEAAKQTTFNAISGTQNQIGTITYRYVLK
jgi:TonB family protein